MCRGAANERADYPKQAFSGWVKTYERENKRQNDKYDDRCNNNGGRGKREYESRDVELREAALVLVDKAQCCEEGCCPGICAPERNKADFKRPREAFCHPEPQSAQPALW